MKRKHLSSGSA